MLLCDRKFDGGRGAVGIPSVYSVFVIDFQLTPHAFLFCLHGFSETMLPSTQTFGNDKTLHGSISIVSFRFVCIMFIWRAVRFAIVCISLLVLLLLFGRRRKIHPSNVDDVGEGISLLIHFSTMDALHAASSHSLASPASRLQLDNNIMRFTGECKIRTFHDGLLFHATPTFGHWRVFIVHLWCAFIQTRTHTHTHYRIRLRCHSIFRHLFSIFTTQIVRTKSAH